MSALQGREQELQGGAELNSGRGRSARRGGAVVSELTLLTVTAGRAIMVSFAQVLLDKNIMLPTDTTLPLSCVTNHCVF